MAQADVDPAKCIKYAQFASHMERWQFKIIYWVLFIVNLAVLFIGSFLYIKGQIALAELPENSKKLRQRLRTCIILCFGCVIVSTVIVVMEAYALLALQFCDGEDLISVYWSTWTMIQVGSLIAMVGIILAMFHSLKNRQHPPWALALGTPVLVIAGALHLCYHSTMKRVNKVRRNSVYSSSGPPMSQVNTIQASSQEAVDETMHGEFIGFTVDGGPIVRFTNSQLANLPDNAELLGRCDSNRPIVAYRKDSIRFITDSDDDEKEKGPAKATRNGNTSKA